jgi:hypothetical protein
MLLCPLDKTLDIEMAEKMLPKVPTGYSLFHGVDSTSDATGPWDTPESKG